MSENVSENVREPQVLDTIGKGGDYWRIVEIDEKGSITAWRIYDGKIYKKGRPLRINVEKIKDGTFRLLDIPPVTITHQDTVIRAEREEILPPEEEAEEETEKHEPQKVVPAPERCERCEEPEPPAAFLTESYQGMKMRLENRIEELAILHGKVLNENEELKRQLEAVTRDRDMLKVHTKIVEQDKAKAEGQAAGLTTAMNLLIHGQGAKG